MIRNFAALIALAALVVPAAALDPAMTNLVMPGAKVIAGVDVDRVKNSPFGQFLLNQVRGDDPDFQKFLDLTGFDPRRDLREIVVASETGKSPHGLLIARGAFDEARIASLAGLHGGGVVASYQGVRVITSKQGEGMVALPGNGLLIAGSEETVKAAIDRQRAGATLPADVAARVQSAGAGYDAWFVTSAPAGLAQRVPEPNVSGAMQGNVMQAIEYVTGGFRFGANVEFAGEAVTRTDKDATALVDVVRFLASMAVSNRDPKSGFAQMVESLQLTAVGRSVRFNLSAPQEELEKLMPVRRNQRTKKVV